MIHPFRILVAVDSSPPARAAFDHALALGRARGAALTILHAVPAEQPFNRGGTARTALLAAFEARAVAAGVPVRLDVQHGEAAAVILEHATSRQSDLIVIGTHGRTGLARLRRGSIAERVVLRAEQPVLIVPAGTSVGRPFARIVVGVDSGPASEAAVAQALALSASPDRVTLVHVLPEHVSARPPLAWRRYGAEEFQRQVVADGWRRLHDSVARIAAPEARPGARVATGATSAEIVRIAAEVEAGAIVLGVRRRGAIGRAVLGATAIDVLRAGGRPVLAVPEGASVSPRLAPPRDVPRRLAA
jgi:nucleotide-binding universal stress UspA family protein